MNKIVMRGKKYKIVSNENQYELKTIGNALLLKRGNEVYITLDLDKVCLGTKLAILENVGVVLEEIPKETEDIFDMWLEKNPGKTFDEFTDEVIRTISNHCKDESAQIEGLDIGVISPKRIIVMECKSI
ncbi:hypothetical protein H3N56_03015 [Cetobacterium sp. 2A]|uniref:hypothetical protein n=1 Tax=Cetobacterium sp. 2A TaxID=2754723 RepID=UPI00163CED86|nr:hypothetical protein [Cetobacterium sp. 2A]MBC2855465.1 hypothetical protein [Cetobacterium sp. 2A]